jgi:phosphoribosylformylglycinamidine synthase
VPTYTELGIFSVMWSEHCSYKSSKRYLRTLPTRGPQVLQGPGENAGAVSIGEGWAAVFKIESHNHPSYVEPHAGAATGVGGILRDIFTMGARPLASLDSLRFGDLADPHQRHLMRGVVAGVADYGNCFGCATVGGELTFHPRYGHNILVNAMNVGIAREKALFSARAQGVGNPVIYVGSKTGRDGIHGASLLASSQFDDETDAKRPTVQVGDPFAEKLLLEACLEAMQTGAVVGIQDMGAAGLTCSSFEMAFAAQTGIDLDLDRVPQRELGMTPYELMLSESQERMLLVAEAGREKELEAIFAKWDLDFAVVGQVTADGVLRVRWRGEIAAEIPVAAVAAGTPELDRPVAPRRAAAAPVDLASVSVPRDLGAALLELLGSANLCSRAWVYEQYDQIVQSGTVLRPGGDAAVVRVPHTERALALATDCNPRYCAADPFLGAQHAVAEAARNVAVTGARPLAVTNCLNFGSPERPEIMAEFVEAVRGMAQACEAFETPIVSGNVSFYNETAGHGAIPPTPTIGMVGLLEQAECAVRAGFRAAGHGIAILGAIRPSLGASEYLAVIHGREEGPPPPLDLAAERALHAFLHESAQEKLLASAHDVSEGGLAVALAECSMFSGIGGSVQLPAADGLRADVLLFGELAGCAVISFTAESRDRLRHHAAAAGVAFREVGTTGGERIAIEPGIDVSLEQARSVWASALGEALDA